MKKLICSLILSFAWLTSFAMPSISNLKVTPIAPWGMAIDYTVSGAETADADLPLVVIAPGVNKIHKANNLEGDVKWVNGEHCVYWNQSKDGITTDSRNGPVSVFYCPAYCIIDLSSGAESSAYPVTYLDAEPTGGFNTTEYKTTKLVLKRVDAGLFIMGDDKTDETHRVMLTKPYYLGLFEMTQSQWLRVMESNPSENVDYLKPVDCVSYDKIRGSSEGAQWPSSNSVDEDSFLGILRARTGINFDLPTEAQWEYACRAGTTTKYSFGDTANGDYMWYKGNTRSNPQRVGEKAPNPWGFYDMHGNVWEWCLNWYGDLLYGTDPLGASFDSSWFGPCRIARGGAYYSDATSCVSYRRYGCKSSDRYMVGFRLAWTLSD